jgi:antitoxin VapB
MASRKKTKRVLGRNKQAVTIPRKALMSGVEAKMQRQGSSLTIRPKKQTWQSLTNSLAMFTDDFMEEGRQQPQLQKRKFSFA